MLIEHNNVYMAYIINGDYGSSITMKSKCVCFLGSKVFDERKYTCM